MDSQLARILMMVAAVIVTAFNFWLLARNTHL